MVQNYLINDPKILFILIFFNQFLRIPGNMRQITHQDYSKNFPEEWEIKYLMCKICLLLYSLFSDHIWIDISLFSADPFAPTPGPRVGTNTHAHAETHTCAHVRVQASTCALAHTRTHLRTCQVPASRSLPVMMVNGLGCSLDSAFTQNYSFRGGGRKE